MGSPRISKSLPLQVAAVCYRRRGPEVEFLLVNTNGGNKWTFPKGSPDAHLSHSQAAEREAVEEAAPPAPSSRATFTSTFIPRVCSGSRGACRNS
jgi:ADP-ribose pyrophosphatase YjhB (NUDIX family)